MAYRNTPINGITGKDENIQHANADIKQPQTRTAAYPLRFFFVVDIFVGGWFVLFWLCAFIVVLVVAVFFCFFCFLERCCSCFFCFILWCVFSLSLFFYFSFVVVVFVVFVWRSGTTASMHHSL